MAIDLGNDDGFVEVRCGEAVVTIDLWQVHHQIFELHQKNKDRPNDEYNAALVEFMVSLGLPKCSQRMATQFVERIGQAVEATKKNSSGTAALPASTASTPEA